MYDRRRRATPRRAVSVVVHCREVYKCWLCRSSLTMTAESPSAESDVPPTVLSTLQATLIPSSLHPFSSSGEQTVALLHALLDTTEHVAHAVTLHSATLVNDSKTVPRLRQQSAGQHTLHLVNDVLYPSLSAACAPLSARVFSDRDFPPSLACRWKNHGCSRGAQTRRHRLRWPVRLLKYARAYQRVELSSGYANLPRERPRHAPTSRRGFSRFGCSAPTRADGTRVVRWLGYRGPP
jgi:hypothetical protein